DGVARPHLGRTVARPEKARLAELAGERPKGVAAAVGEARREDEDRHDVAPAATTSRTASGRRRASRSVRLGIASVSGRRAGQGLAQEGGIEDAVGHHLAALHEAVLVGSVVGDRVVKRADVIPHEHVILRPGVYVLILRLKLMREEVLEDPFALGGIELVDADRVAGVAIEHGAAGDRMSEKERMDGRRAPPSLLLRERRPQTAGTAPHVLPELV